MRDGRSSGEGKPPLQSSQRLWPKALLWKVLLVCIAAGILSPATSGSAGSSASSVHGRIELFNSQSKKPRGEPDASGVAVWLMPMKGTQRPESNIQPKARLEQRDKRFTPHVMVIQTGTEVEFPNNDPFFHNVFSVYDGKTFDLGLYSSGESRPVRFDRPGISFIFCNIHPQMSAVIVAVATSHFAVTAPDGTFAINGLAPGGTYELNLWYERCGAKQLEALKRNVLVDSTVVDLGAIRLDEAGYIPKNHKNKFGEDYPANRGTVPYRGH